MSVRAKPNREREPPAEPEADESDLPEGWTSAALSLLCERQRGVSYGRDDARSEPGDGLKPILRANNIDGDRLNFNDLVYVPGDRVSENQRLRPGDVVIAMSSGSKSVVGKTAQIFDEWDGSFGAFCGVLRPHSEMDARYFGLFLRTREYRQAISELSAGTNINNLKAEHFDVIQVPIAPLPEQQRIVAKLELLLGQVSSSQQRLARVPGLLKRFRQSVLAAACSGKLSADWRENSPTEPCGDSEDSSELPMSWRTQVLESITETGRPISYGVLKPGPFVVGGIPLVRIVDIVRDRLALDEMHRVSPELSAQYRRTVLSGGEILISLVGTIGRIAWSPSVLCGANVHRNIGVIASGADVDSKFLSFSMQSESVQSQIRDVTTGASQPLLNLGDVRQLRIAIPPLAEQQEIVQRVEKLFAFADQIEARLRQAQTHVDRLTQSLLAKAFRGELVPTEHALALREGRNYEPASALLDRIRASSQAAATTNGQGSNRTSTRRTRSRQSAD